MGSVAVLDILNWVNGLVWGAPALVLILGVGIWITVRTGFVQLRLFPTACRDFMRQFRRTPKEKGEVSPFQALCTALAATVGTGNIAGVAGAIAIGGPGSVFWMWICAILGMATKFAEATLAVRFRQRDSRGEYVGGPMYVIRNGLDEKWHFLGGLYSFFGVVAAFGVGNATQVNAVIVGVNQALGAYAIEESTAGNLAMGVVLALGIGIMLSGGLKRISRGAEMLVPFASCAYLLLGIIVLVIRRQWIAAALCDIVTAAFSPEAVTGGIVGSAFTALRTGVSRGVFTNEAGMGTAAIAHAAANVDHPVRQGLMGIMEVFLDTVVICTMTALVILVSGVPIPYGTDVGAALTEAAFSSVCGPWAAMLIAFCLCLFAVATILGWGLYGARCAQFLFGSGVWRKFVFLQVITIILGAVLKTRTVWMLSETVNGLMAIPNLIALLLLTPEWRRLTRDFQKKNILG